MKYFLDTEFIEGFLHVPKPRHFIDLISIGVISEDVREYYAISNEWSAKDANEWVKENVISKLDHTAVWKTNDKIRVELLEFFGCKQDTSNGTWEAPEGIEVYGYFADYDWVLFCSLFGRMIDLPKNFPFYCRDLKQMMDDNGLTKEWKKEHCPDPEDEHNALADARWNLKLFTEITKHINEKN